MKALSRLQLNMLHASQQYTHYPTQIGCFLDVSKLTYSPKTIESFFHTIDEINQTIDMTNHTPVWIPLEVKPCLEFIQSSKTQLFFEAAFEFNQPFYRMAIEIETKRLVFVANHCLVDGTSIQLLMTRLYQVLQNKAVEPFMKPLEEAPLQPEMQGYYEKKVIAIRPSFIKSHNPLSGVHSAKRQRFILDPILSKSLHSIQPISRWVEAALALYIQYLHPNQPIRYGKILSQRRRDEKTAIGLFSQAYPVHLNPSEFLTIEAFLNQIDLIQIAMIRRRFIDFESLLYTSKKHHQTAQLFDYTLINHSLNYEEQIPIVPLFYPYLDQSLVINVLEGEVVTLYLDYQVDVYSDEMIKRLFKRIEFLLSQMRPNTYLSNLKVLFDEEVPHLKYKKTVSLLELYYQNLTSKIDQVAIIDSRTVTYKKLEEDSNRLSHVFNKRIEEVIIIQGNKTYESILMMLSAIKAGKPFVFSTSETKSLLDEPLDLDRILWHTQSPDFVDYPKDKILAYYFTSGTTGRKKVAITHEALSNHISDTPYILHAKSLSSIPLLSALHFDMSLEEIWVVLAHKLTLVMFSDTEFKQPKLRTTRFQQYPVDGITTTPSLIRLLLDQNLEIFNDLKWVVLGGEVLTPALTKRLLSFPNIQLFNSYGPTETTIAITSTEIHSGDDISIGKPHPNTQVVIFNEHPLPWGEVGEILVNGVCVSPSITTKTYEGLAYYPTHDFGYQDDQSVFHFMGRMDRTIKRHGVRIDLNWIDYILQKHPWVTQVTSVFEHNQINTYIQMDHPIDETLLWAYLSDTLSPNQKPNRLIFTNQITNEGKILSKNEVKRTPFKPINLKEKAIFHALSVVLNQSVFNLEDNIANYGADSLSVIQILSILDQYGYEFSIEHVETKTISQWIKDTKKRSIQYRYLKSPNQSQKIELMTPVCLYGANGFLGIHLLDALLNKTKSHVICPIRVSKETLERTFMYYLNRPLNMNRISLFPFNTPISSLNISAIINASGNTKYQGKTSDFDEINVNFVLDLGHQAKALNIPLIHISTLGLGTYERIFDEDRKRLRMTFSNPYLVSKAKAEVGLCNIPELQFKLIRVGNLTPSTLTMQPQLNADNAFMKGLYHLIHHQNSNLFGIDFDLTPVDIAADAILQVIKSNLTISHVIHPSRYHYESLCKCRESTQKSHIIRSNQTNQALNQLGFTYPKLSQDYLKQMLKIAQKNRDE